MKRSTYTVTLFSEAGDVLSTATAYAWNSGVRASERLVREYARAAGEMFRGGRPKIEYSTYRRHWFGERSNVHVVATVTAVA